MTIPLQFILPLISVLFATELLDLSSEDSRGESKIKVIIDADTANEVDDLFALVGAVANPVLAIKGITSAQFHTSPLASENSVLESQKINEDLLKLMNVSHIPLPLGASKPLDNVDKPQVSEASDFIVSQVNALAEGDSIVLVILGSCTNVASAILQDPSIIGKIRVYYLGFWHDPLSNSYNKKEFNSGNDTLAMNLLLDTPGLDLTVMTATTSQHLVFEKSRVVDELSDKGDLGKYLLERWTTFDRWWTPVDPEKNKWIMWDVAIIESLASPHLATVSTFLAPPENTSRSISIFTEIEEIEMQKGYWQALDAYFPNAR